MLSSVKISNCRSWVKRIVSWLWLSIRNKIRSRSWIRSMGSYWRCMRKWGISLVWRVGLWRFRRWVRRIGFWLIRWGNWKGSWFNRKRKLLGRLSFMRIRIRIQGNCCRNLMKIWLRDNKNSNYSCNKLKQNFVRKLQP